MPRTVIAPQRVQISYNNPAAVGTFNILQQAYGNTPYHFSVGDLNNDNLPRLLVNEDVVAGRLVIPFESAYRSRDAYCLVYPAAKRGDQKIQLLRRWLVDEAKRPD